jgi:tetratricopeptide (TPR) repeat protein
LDEEALSLNAGQEILFAKAKRCYEKILAIQPDHPQTIIDLGDFWRRKKNYDNALKFYDKAIRLLHCEVLDISTQDDLKDIYHEKLLILEEMGNNSEYKKTLNEAKLYFPESKLFKH